MSVMKVILLGDSGVGKTSTITRFVQNTFNSTVVTTGIDTSTKVVQVGDKSVHLQIWDTIGNEKFHSMGSTYYQAVACCILVFDLSAQQSFEHLTKWRDEFLMQAGPSEISSFPMFVVGNKADACLQREVPKKLINNWCQQHYNLPYFEVSAKENIQVQELFYAVAARCLARANPVDSIIIDKATVTVNPKKLKRKSKKNKCEVSNYKGLLSSKKEKGESKCVIQ